MDLRFPWLIVIPARLASTRLPRKPLQLIGKDPLLVKVYKRLLPLKAKNIDLIAAIDSPELVELCEKYSVPWQMTKTSHATGSERCQEVAEKSKAPYILNVQGDEPFISVNDLRNLMQAMEADTSLDMGTLGYLNEDLTDYQNPNVVKIVLNQQAEALYFSRAAIPFYRDKPQEFSFIQHQGVYAFRRETLNRFRDLPRSALEIAESLEQLRALENGLKIKVVMASERSFGIDTLEDLELARKRVQSEV